MDNKKLSEIEERQTTVILGAIVKAILIISLSIMMIAWGYSCQLNQETIQECKSACSSSESQMASVTNRECRCEKTPASNWVIPRTKSTAPVAAPP